MDRVAVPHGPIWLGATVLVVDDELSMRGSILAVGLRGSHEGSVVSIVGVDSPR
jgi:hypothetical protein